MTLTELAEQAKKLETPEQIESMELDLAAVQEILRQKKAKHAPAKAEDPNRNVDLEEASRVSGMSQSWLRKHADELPFTVRIGKRRMFHLPGLQKWLVGRTQAKRA